MHDLELEIQILRDSAKDVDAGADYFHHEGQYNNAQILRRRAVQIRAVADALEVEVYIQSVFFAIDVLVEPLPVAGDE
jgi:hypothetical protein